MRIHKAGLAAALIVAALIAGGCGGGSAASEETAAESAFARQTEETGASGNEAATEDADAQRGTEESGEPDNGRVAGENETVSQRDVVEDGMVPVYGDAIRDGVYAVKVDSSSSMFKITACELTVEDGSMSAFMTLSGTGYSKLYLGTGQEAARASEADCIPYEETANGAYAYRVTVEALDMGIDCSAFSKNKEKWYDRTLVFRADSLPAKAFAEGKIATAESLNLEDGVYTCQVKLGGGSGRASVESPAKLRVEGGAVTASIVWGSANYDYMKVDGEKYELVNTEGNSAFEIPVSCFDWRIPVIADTIAMSVPHEIEYTLTFDSATLERAE
ncbi:MAG: hypothetical protein KH230_19685 [Enterocloster asparagiformis]|nr:hypothetical protein [Enterocloster asparagiformis]